MTICTITLYGKQELNYSTFSSAVIYQFYSPIFVQMQGESNFDLAEWSFKLLNMSLYYLLIIYHLMAVFMSITHDSYRNISILFGDPLRAQ